MFGHVDNKYVCFNWRESVKIESDKVADRVLELRYGMYHELEKTAKWRES